MSKPRCPTSSHHPVVMGRGAGSNRQFWHCMTCRNNIARVASDDAHELSQMLYALAELLEVGDRTVTAHTDRSDETAKITHHTYVVSGGLDRVEIKLRRPEE